MFSDIITALSDAFGEVVQLVTDILGDGFAAVGQLSSGVFESADSEA